MLTSAFNKPTLLFAAALLMAGCSKTGIKPSANLSAADQSSAKSATLFSGDADFSVQTTSTGTTIVQYRPGPDDGEDVYSDFYHNNMGVNQNLIPELPVNAWNYQGYILTRSFIKFTKLYKFPSTTQIVSAKLHLYPPKDFLNHPQGNTGANECLIQRITSKSWSEESLLWTNQPRGVATDDESIIPATTDQFGYSPVIDITAPVAKMIAREVHNYGFRITLTNETPFAAVNFASSEATDSWRRPMLEIEYK